MKIRIPAVLVATATLGTILSAQEPLSQETMNKASYAMGTSVGRQVQADQQNLTQEKFLEGFQDVVNQEVDIKAAMSYAEGMRMALRLQNDPMGMNPEQVLRGMKDATTGAELAYPEEELQAAMQELQQFAQAKQMEQMQQQQQQQQAMQAKAQENLEQGEKFLEENAGKEGVMTTLTGLQYKVLEEGDGKKPGPEDTVKVHYTGKLLSGKVFDSSVERGEPVEFKLNQVIPGWTEGLQLMSEGAKYRFWIPADLAYGRNAPPSIGPNQVLDFEVELLEVK